MTLGEKIQKYRRLSGLSQEQLAEQMGVSRQAVSKWELGDTVPDADRIIQMARIFSVSTDTLLLDTPEPEPYPAGQEYTPEPHAGTDWPGKIGRLFRKKGYIAGYLIAGYAAGILLLMRLAHFGFSQILSVPDGFGPLPAAFRMPLTITNLISIIALLFVIAGIVLALVWKKRTKADDIHE